MLLPEAFAFTAFHRSPVDGYCRSRPIIGNQFEVESGVRVGEVGDRQDFNYRRGRQDACLEGLNAGVAGKEFYLERGKFGRIDAYVRHATIEISPTAYVRSITRSSYAQR